LPTIRPEHIRLASALFREIVWSTCRTRNYFRPGSLALETQGGNAHPGSPTEVGREKAMNTGSIMRPLAGVAAASLTLAVVSLVLELSLMGAGYGSLWLTGASSVGITLGCVIFCLTVASALVILLVALYRRLAL